MELDIDPEDLAAHPVKDEVVRVAPALAIVLQFQLGCAHRRAIEFFEYSLGQIADDKLPEDAANPSFGPV